MARSGPSVGLHDVRRLSLIISYCIASAVTISGAERKPDDLQKLPPPATRRIEFSRDVEPILERSCLRCHGPERPKSKFRLDHRATALQGGENDARDIIPGD